MSLADIVFSVRGTLKGVRGVAFPILLLLAANAANSAGHPQGALQVAGVPSGAGAGLPSHGMAGYGGQVLYVATNGVDDAAHGLTPESPLRTPQVAIDRIGTTGVVFLAEGLYEPTNAVNACLVITNAVKVYGAGRDKTIISLARQTNIRGAHLDNSEALLSGVTIRDARLTKSILGSAAGGVCITSKGGLLIDSTVTNNLADVSNGIGGLQIAGGAARHCRIVNNRTGQQASNTAGVQQSGGTVADSLIAGNSGPSMANGSGITAAGVRFFGGLMERCIITCNTNTCSSYGAGGGVCMLGAATLRNCLVAGNRAVNSADSSYRSAAGLTINNANALAENVTVADNVNLNSVWDGVLIASGTLRNAVVARNGLSALDADLTRIGGTVTYSLFKESDGSNNCSSDAPVFADPASGDYRLAFGSAGIDAGEARTAFTDDLDGVTRPVDGTGDGEALWDMGCYEWTLPEGATFACTFTTDASEYTSPATVICTPLAPSVVIDTCVWSFTDASQTRVYTSEGNAPFTTPPLPAGYYAITLVVTNNAGETAASLPQSISILPTTVYVSKSGSHIWPFDHPDRAATNIYEAIGAVYGTPAAPGTVHVAAGDYDGLQTTAFDDADGVSDYIGVLNRPVRVLGAGPETTILRCRRTANPRISGFWIEHEAAVLSGVTIRGANAGDNNRVGAALNLYNGLVTNCIVRDNHGNARPAVHMRGGRLVASVITNNTANGTFGIGGLGIEDGTVSHCRIVRNTTSNNGSYSAGVQQSGGTVADSLIAGNSGPSMAHNSGHAAAGVRFFGGLMERCIITCNTNTCSSYGAGGGVCMLGAATLRNCLVAGNRAVNSADSSYRSAAGLTINNANALAENVTVADNVNLNSVWDGVLIASGTLRNAVVARNGLSALDADLTRIGGTVTYSLFKESDGSNNCSSDAPVFADPASGDYRLAFGSAGIDAGEARTAFTDDLDGVTRPVDGTGDGEALWDMGCYEWTLPEGATFACTFTTDASEYTSPATVICTPLAPSVVIDTCVWSFTDASQTRVYTSEGNAPFTTPPLPAGYYAITLVVTNNAGETAASLPQSISILPTTVYVSKSGSHIWPFDHPDRAATNIYEAIGAVYGTPAAPGTVHVAAGDYDGLQTTAFDDADGVSDYIGVLNRPVRVLGAGPETTILRCRRTANPRISGFWIEHEAAVLSGVTIRGANAGDNNRVGAALNLYNGLVTNCIVRDNHGNARPAVHMRGGRLVASVITNNTANGTFGIGGLGIEDGTVSHCRIVRNTTSNNGSYSAGVQQSGGTVADSLIAGNSGPSMAHNSGHAAAGVRFFGGLMERCVISCNTNTSTSSNPAGGIYVLGKATVRNCLIAGNESRNTTTDIAAGLTVTDAGAVIENVTVVDNHNPNAAADGIRIKAGTLRNAIAWNNGAADADNLNRSGGTVTYSCFPTAVEGDGNHNQAGAPVFRNAAAGDYRLTPEARSCINRGYTASWGPGDKDLAGDKRISGRFCDIGAYEYQYRGTTLVLR